MRDRCPYDGDRLDGASVCPTCQRVFSPPAPPPDDDAPLVVGAPPALLTRPHDWPEPER